MEGIIRRYIASNKHSRPEDWIDDNARLNNAFLKSIRNQHFNFSASKLDMGYGPRFDVDPITRKKRRRREYVDA